MSKLLFWKGFKAAELRGLPIVCNACKSQVTINGDIENGVLVFDDCPACGSAIDGMLYMKGEERVGDQTALMLGAEIKWFTEGANVSESSAKIERIIQVPNLLMQVLDTGVKHYAHSNLPKNKIYRMIVGIILQSVLSPADTIEVIAEVNKHLRERHNIAADHGIVEDKGNGKPLKNPRLDDILGDDEEEDEK